MNTELLEIVNDLLGHNTFKVKQLAELVGAIDSDLKDGLLTKEEYEELLSDVEKYKKIIETSNDIQLNAKINSMIKLLIEPAKYAKF